MTTFESASIALATIAMLMSAYSIMSAFAAKRSALAAETQAQMASRSADAAEKQAKAAADQLGILAGSMLRERCAELESEIRFGLDVPSAENLRRLNDIGAQMDWSQEGFATKELSEIMMWISRHRSGAREFEHHSGRPETTASRAALADAAERLQQTVGRAALAYMPGSGRFSEYGGSTSFDPGERNRYAAEACDAVEAFRQQSFAHNQALSAENQFYRAKITELEGRLLTS